MTLPGKSGRQRQTLKYCKNAVQVLVLIQSLLQQLNIILSNLTASRFISVHLLSYLPAIYHHFLFGAPLLPRAVDIYFQHRRSLCVRNSWNADFKLTLIVFMAFCAEVESRSNSATTYLKIHYIKHTRPRARYEISASVYILEYQMQVMCALDNG